MISHHSLQKPFLVILVELLSKLCCVCLNLKFCNFKEIFLYSPYFASNSSNVSMFIVVLISIIITIILLFNCYLKILYTENVTYYKAC